MAGTAFAATVLLSLFLLAAARHLPSEVEFLTTLSSDAAAIRLSSDKPSEESVPKPTVAEFPSDDEPLESVPMPTVAEFASRDKTSEEIFPTAAVAEFASADTPPKASVAGFASVDTPPNESVAEFAAWDKPYKHIVAEFAAWDKPYKHISNYTVAEFTSNHTPSKFISKGKEVATESILPAADAVVGSRTVPIEVSLIPVRSFPFSHPRVVGRPSWHRLGRHCHHMHRFLRGEFRRGDFIPYGDDMVVPADHVRRGYEGGRYFAREARAGRFHHPATMEEISVEDLGKQREVGFPRELRPFPKFRHHGHGEEKERGLVSRFLDLLNLH